MKHFFKRVRSVFCWYAFRLLPVNNTKIWVTSYYGRGYSDNPKMIVEELRKRKGNYQIYWVVSNEKEASTLPEDVIPCQMGTVSYIYHASTARIWIDNCRKFDRFKKKQQFYMQTWHGFALKRIEADAGDTLEPVYIARSKRDSKYTDLMISGSESLTQLYHNSFWYDGQVANYGSPRNDVFFHDNTSMKSRILQHYSLPEDRKLLLYAPTFRADKGTSGYLKEIDQTLDACAARFGGQWSALIRLHPNVTAQSAGLYDYDGDRLINATYYADMQELLCAADVELTDYSSSIFDFALSGKPVFQYTSDIEAYMADRNFYYPVDQWPFRHARTPEKLAQCIREWDQQEAAAQWDAFSKKVCFYEDGHASERCADLIDRIIAEK